MGQTAFLKKVVCPVSFFALAFFFGLPVLSALEVPQRADGYVTDRAGLLSPSAKAGLEATLRSFEEKTSNQVMVVTFPSLEGDSLEDFSMRLAEAWKAGQKGRDNGVIFLIFKNDRKMRIEVGYGLEGVLPDALAGQIMSQVVAPYFRRGDYSGGIVAGADAIMKATQGEFKGLRKKESSADWQKWFVFFWLFFFIRLFFRGVSLSAHERKGRKGQYKRPGIYWTGGGGGVVGGGFGGFGGFTGGGGGFGGGGASGRW